MKTNQEQIIEALSGLIPEETQKSVQEMVANFCENAKSELEKEFNSKLEEAYEEIQAKEQENEKIALEGYTQAWEIITDLRNRLTSQNEEFEVALKDGFEEAYQMLQEERAKKDMLEVEMYDEYDKRLADIKEYMIDKMDHFLQQQGDKYYEMAKQTALNDPTVAEHRVAFEKILEVAANYLSDEDYAYATNSKVETLQRTFEDAKAQMRILEAKNMRLATENNKLNEAVRQSQEVINEHAGKTDKKARIEKASKAEGRAKLSTNPKEQVVLKEYQAGETVAERNSEEQGSEALSEQFGENVDRVVNDWKHLSGLMKEETEVSSK